MCKSKQLGILLALSLGLFNVVLAQPSEQATLMGYVTAADTQLPLVGATVLSQQDGQSRGTTTSSDGAFELVFPAGTISLEIQYLGYTSYQTILTLEAGQTTAHTISLEPAPITLSGLEIIGNRQDIYQRLPGTVTRLSPNEVDLIQPIGTQELLEYVPGIHGFADDGFSNARLSIGIRGLNPRRSARVLVLEDGIPIQPAMYVYANIYYNPPVERIERVEVIKGSAAIKYGPQTMGGVVNYITSRPRTGFGGTIHLTGGTNGYLSTFAEIAGFGSKRVAPEVQLLFKRGDGYRQKQWI
ncbi:MAG: TonB-dependent receptor plug domain-containing protein [Rhodothermales bacterium]